MPRDQHQHQVTRLPVITARPTLDLERLTPYQVRQAVGRLFMRPVGSWVQVCVDGHPRDADFAVLSLIAEAAIARALHLEFVGDPDHVEPWTSWVRELVARRVLGSGAS